ncbi:MAG TPA: ATP-binding protein [Feifaniaceae bacterium]|nr:ATP-binding protein [Feifaniaceae bacterium]
MQKTVNRYMVLLSLASVLLLTLLTLGVFYGVLTGQLREEQRSEAAYVAAGMELSGDEAYLNRIRRVDDTRLTLIAVDGTVLYDSSADASNMENHGDRPEVAAALEKGAGESARPSETLGLETLYYAEKLPDGNVLRLADTQASVWGVLWRMLPAAIGTLVLTLCICVLLARRMTRHIVSPLNALDLDDPLNNEVYDELSPLLSRLEAQKRQIASQMRELTARSDEFSAIAHNMREGLLVLNANGIILTINRSAQRLFRADSRTCTGKHVLTVDRSLKLQTAVEQAAKGVPAEQVIQLNGRSYQLIASPVRERDAVTGVVALIMDFTEREEQERMRREFSANVSHELKTPLTSISGYAEIMKDGLVKPEDMRGFAQRIHEESTRLMAMVEDIIRLSRLDEGAGDLPFERVELLSLANGVIERLQPVAQAQDVALRAEGEQAEIDGAKQVLEEILYNLCDNGIRYNKPGGSVTIRVYKQAGGRVNVAVSDTGIGIPPEHQNRVFERFYRVDKSHSKETGGTGLGLAIVKRGALMHGAKLSLESAVGRGTTITLKFPAPAARDAGQ